MKKSLIALAVAAAVPALAQAQTNVTMFGIADAAVQYSAGKGNGNNLKLVNSGLNSSRFGVRGVEDLGGGLQAGFWLEAGANTDDGAFGNTNTNNQTGGANTSGALQFNRRSTVSLMGGFGELRLGRDYTPSFWNHTVYDAFGTNGVGSGLNVQSPLMTTTVRASNSIGYFLPSGMPVFGQVMVALGENGSTAGATKNDGRYFGARVGASFGPAQVAVAYGQEKNSGNLKRSDANIGAKFAMGAVTLMGLVDASEVVGGDKRQYVNVGMNWAVGAGTVKASVVAGSSKPAAGGAKTSDALQLSAGYQHDLSKRTAVYGTASVLDNRKAFANRTNARAVTTAGGNAMALEVGLRHSF
jgi:predicted porin